jgi:hypothetical protein
MDLIFLDMTVTNQNCICEEVWIRLHSENIWYCSAYSLSSCRLYITVLYIPMPRHFDKNKNNRALCLTDSHFENYSNCLIIYQFTYIHTHGTWSLKMILTLQFAHCIIFIWFRNCSLSVPVDTRVLLHRRVDIVQSWIQSLTLVVSRLFFIFLCCQNEAMWY